MIGEAQLLCVLNETHETRRINEKLEKLYFIKIIMSMEVGESMYRYRQTTKEFM